MVEHWGIFLSSNILLSHNILENLALGIETTMEGHVCCNIPIQSSPAHTYPNKLCSLPTSSWEKHIDSLQSAESGGVGSVGRNTRVENCPLQNQGHC